MFIAEAVIELGYVYVLDVLTAIAPEVTGGVYVDAIVIVSVFVFVVIAIELPASNVNVSSLVSATTVACPDTAIFLNMLCVEPLSIFSTKAVPFEYVTPIPEIPPPAALTLPKPTVVSVAKSVFP